MCIPNPLPSGAARSSSGLRSCVCPPAPALCALTFLRFLCSTALHCASAEYGGDFFVQLARARPSRPRGSSQAALPPRPQTAAVRSRPRQGRPRGSGSEPRTGSASGQDCAGGAVWERLNRQLRAAGLAVACVYVFCSNHIADITRACSWQRGIGSGSFKTTYMLTSAAASFLRGPAWEKSNPNLRPLSGGEGHDILELVGSVDRK